MTEPRITVAHLLRPQGRHGELLAELLTDFPESLPGRTVRIDDADHTIVEYFLPTGRNAGRIVLKFAAIDSIEAAEALAQHDVTIAAEERIPLADDENYISDLIGCTLYDRDHAVGSIIDVEDPTGSAELGLASNLVVRDPAGVEHLVPYVKAWLLTLDTAARRIVMTLPPGLIDLNKI